ncbi:hypothetical protein [Kitasatospora cinereorecta]|uniref:Uncharacterized protein n=1 Tax=Kitasatospora cinereorecta TaxID=285560 RepID=A0ABW0VNL1_9ACTN
MWKSPERLRAVLRHADEAGIADDRLEQADWRSLREVIGSRLQNLEAPTGVRPNGQRPSLQPGPAQDQAARTRRLDELRRQVLAGFNDLATTERNLRSAGEEGFLGDKVPGPDGRIHEIGVLLRARVTELRQYAQQQNPDARSHPAAGQQPGHTPTAPEGAAA